MDKKAKQNRKKREIIEEIERILPLLDERKLNAVYRFVLGIK